MRPVVIVRPEPGNARTAERLAALGIPTIRLPLFAITPVAWDPPTDDYDAILLTSANAARHAGPELAAMSHLPVVAVGEETAREAAEAGLSVAIIGNADAETAIAQARAAGHARLLHLAGRDRAAGSRGIDAITVYASDAITAAIDPTDLSGTIVLLHSARAARAFADIAGLDRATITLAVISPAVAAAAGEGWRAVRAASAPDDAALVQLARDLAIDRPPGGGDKAA